MPVQLVKFLQNLVGLVVKIELKNGSVIEGEIVGVDSNMNTVMKDIKVIMKGKEPQRMDQMTIRGGTIRYYNLTSCKVGGSKLDEMLKSCEMEKKPKGKKAAPKEEKK